ncbi:hypothetical protein AXF42_Ash020171 [Apostasia shenzhenica]|uniref:Uncharacterized protein n=1 Tax=Apostasia shenzhenica TaxID=1088818 RepID=A0A2H9ZVZ0_9ASPA|nr:hypothetical protein AXF42_Ash020171 [Apostasia shenzhenica]
MDQASGDVKQEETQVMPQQSLTSNKNVDEDFMYIKALYHVLPLDHVTSGKLQKKLDGEANQNTVRKLLDRMVRDGYLQNSGNRKLGKRVVHSEATSKKFEEVKALLYGIPMEIENNNQVFEFNAKDLPSDYHNTKDGSTFGGLHSIGSDLTRTRERSDAHQSQSMHSGQAGNSKENGQPNTPAIKPEPIASVESGVLGGRVRPSCASDGCRSSQEKKFRKASTIKEPILQYLKRQKSLAQ